MKSSGGKFLVVGAGPVGALIVSDLFLKFDNRNALGKVGWLVRNAEKRDLLGKNGLRVKSASENLDDDRIKIDFDKTSIVEMLDWNDAADCRFDAAIVAVKAYSLESALASVKIASPDTPVLVVVNGLVESLDFVLGVSFGGGSMKGNLLEYTKDPRIHFGISAYEPETSAHCKDCDSMTEGYRVLSGLGGLIEWREDKNVHRTMLEKVIINSIVNPLTAILNAQNEIILYPALYPIIDGLATEICTALNAKFPAYFFDKNVAVENTLDISQSTSVNFSSMLQDVAAGRATEAEYLNAKIIDIAAGFGIPAPLNGWIMEMISAVTHEPAE